MNKERIKRAVGKAYFTLKNYFAWVMVFAVMLAVFATAAGEYNTKNDPLVSLSYVEKLRTELKAEIKAEMEDSIADMVKEEIAKQSQGGGNAEYVFKTITLKVGEKLIAKSSCEIMVRAGACKAITPSVSQSLIDKTTDTSLSNGMDIVKNHLISVPKADGRGIISVWNGTEIMIRGDYEIVS